jgi:SAM-dependent methyltransferase
MRQAKSWLNVCEACGFMSSTLQPGPGTGLVGLENLRRANIRATLDRLEQLGPLRGLRVLDVGCANGWFLEAAKARGAHVHGIEPQDSHVAVARSAGLTVDHGFFPRDLQNTGPFDVIAFNDVFEHLPAPDQAIGDVERLLKPGGLAVINLPSSDGFLFRISRVLDALGMSGTHDRLWQKGMTSPHISYFSPATLQRLVERNSGLRRVDAFPLTSFRRDGLWDRIALTHSGPIAWSLFAGLWSLTFVASMLPSDIHVGVFRKMG